MRITHKLSYKIIQHTKISTVVFNLGRVLTLDF
jgi:hypothetical protein